MKTLRILITALCLAATTALPAQHLQATYQKADSTTICRMLQQAGGNAGPLTFARQLLGRPYVAHTLEINNSEKLVVNTRQLDCTTLVETVAALTLCMRQHRPTWDAYLDMLRTLRYRKGVLNGYASRLHYFSEWIDDNADMHLVNEVQQPDPPFSAEQHIRLDYMSRHPQSYKALKNNRQLVKTICKLEQQYSGTMRRYIPKEALKEGGRQLRDAIHDGDIIAITCTKAGLDIAHLGLAVWKKDGLHLLNASQLHKKVVLEPMTLYQYLQKHPSHTGIRVVRITGMD